MNIAFHNTRFVLAATLFTAFAVLLVPKQALGAGGYRTDGHRLVGLLDYVAADYGGAVEGGKIVDQTEYKEQLSLLTDAEDLIGRRGDVPAQLTTAMDKLEALVRHKADPAQVGEAAGRARRAAIQYFGIILYPKSTPDLSRGEQAYVQNCASCHGKDGAAHTPAATSLTPKPADFTEPKLRSALSPYRVFNTATFGVEGTAMPSFKSLSATQRWDVAFYVMSLADGARESAAANDVRLPEGFEVNIKMLASMSDAELAAKLEEAGAESGDIPAMVARLRLQPPKAALPKPTTSLGIAQRHVAAAREAWKAGHVPQARKELLSAYLDGFEQVESRLGSVDSGLVSKVENQFMALRAALRKGNSQAVDDGFAQLDKSLERASQTLDADASDAWTSAVASALILLREGLEIILLLALLLGMVNRLGFAEAKKYIHIGWIGAVVAGVGTWVAAQKIITISGAGREVLEGVVGVFAAVVLFSVSYWFLSKVHGEKWAKFIKEKLEQRITSGNLWAIAGLSFLAVYRELFEVILYFQALFLESGSKPAPILGGALVAGVLLAAIAYLILKAGTTLPLKPFFAVSGAALYTLSIVLMGKGLHALIEGGILPVVRVPFFGVSWLGVYPQAITLAAQAVLVVLAVVWVVNARNAKVFQG